MNSFLNQLPSHAGPTTNLACMPASRTSNFLRSQLSGGCPALLSELTTLFDCDMRPFGGPPASGRVPQEPGARGGGARGGGVHAEGCTRRGDARGHWAARTGQRPVQSAEVSRVCSHW